MHNKSDSFVKYPSKELRRIPPSCKAALTKIRPAGSLQIVSKVFPSADPIRSFCGFIKLALYFLAALLTAAFSMSLAQSTVFAEVPDVIFILDGSGSMAAKMGERTRIQVAREVMEYAVPALPKEIKVGLAAYGHHRKGDCADMEILVNPEKGARDTVLSKIKEIRTVGMTPIAAAVEMVAKTIKIGGREDVIVLVSDGEETCHKDPCGFVKGLKDSGMKFVLHVVGFGVTQNEEKQLRCLAQAGGGSYFPAGDAKGLLSALESVRKDLEVKVEAARTKTVRASSRLGKFLLKVPKSAVSSLAVLKIIRQSDNTVVKEAKAIEETHPLPAGRYGLVLGFANPNYQPPTEVSIGECEIRGGETSEVSLGAIVINMAPPLGEAAWQIGLLNEESGKFYLQIESHGNDYYLMKPKAAPEGTYSIAFTYAASKKPFVVARGLSVKAGKETVATLDSGIAIKKSSSGIEGWDVVPSGSKAPVLEITRRWDNDYPLWESFPIEPGNYDILVHVKGMKEPMLAGEAIEIKKGETIVFDAGL